MSSPCSPRSRAPVGLGHVDLQPRSPRLVRRPVVLADRASLVVHLLERDDDEPVDRGPDDRPLRVIAHRQTWHSAQKYTTWPLTLVLATTPRQRRQAWPSRS